MATSAREDRTNRRRKAARLKGEAMARSKNIDESEEEEGGGSVKEQEGGKFKKLENYQGEG